MTIEHAAAHSDDIDAVRRCEEHLRLAMLAGDVAALAALLDDHLVFTAPDGTLLDKPQDLAAHASRALTLDRIAVATAAFHPIGTMVLTTTRADLSGSFAGVPFAGPFAYTRLWSRASGRWRVVAGHASALAG